MKKRFLVLSVIMVLVLNVFTACQSGQEADSTADSGAPASSAQAIPSDSGGDSGSSKPVKLTFWLKKTFSADNDAMLEQRALDYGKEKGIEVVVEHIPSSNILEVFNAAIEANNLPDVSFLTSEVLKTFYQQGILAPIDDVKTNIEAGNGPFSVSYASAGIMSDGKVYSLPLYGSPRVLYYREDLLQAAGYTEPPKTWEELREVAKATTDEAAGIYGFGQQLSPCADFENAFRGMLWSNGGSLWDADGNVALNTPAVAESLQMWIDMYSVDKSIPSDALSWDDSGNNSAYLAGTTAMVINTNTILRALQAEGYEELYKNTKIAPCPTGPDGTRLLFGGGCFAGIFASTENLEASKELLEYIYDNDWYIQWLSEVCGEMTPVFTDMAAVEPFASTENVPMLIDGLNASVFPGYPGPYTAAAGDMTTSKLLGYAVQDMVMNNVSAQDGLADLQKTAEEFVASR